MRFCIFFGESISKTESRSRILCRLWSEQESMKCSVSSGAHRQSHQSLGVSMKLWCLLWHFNGLRPSLNWKIYLRPMGSWIPKTDFIFWTNDIKNMMFENWYGVGWAILDTNVVPRTNRIWIEAVHIPFCVAEKFLEFIWILISKWAYLTRWEISS